MIGIIVAMSKELSLLMEHIENVSEEVVDGYLMRTGIINGRHVVAMQCGIGKVNAALGARAMIESYHPTAIINTGVAGGTGEGASILDVVLANKVAYHDVWCGPGTQWGQAADCPLFFECEKAEYLASEIDVKAGLVASGDIFVSTEKEVERILALYPDAIAVDMESAAIAQTCYLNGVNFYCLRVVSDTPGAADNIAQYDNFWEDAPRHTFAAVSQLINKI